MKERWQDMFKALDGTSCSQSQENRRTFGKGCLVYGCSQILVKKIVARWIFLVICHGIFLF
jgi:hypothetical protein